MQPCAVVVRSRVLVCVAERKRDADAFAQRRLGKARAWNLSIDGVNVWGRCPYYNGFGPPFRILSHEQTS